jgi:hypothetical protein
MDKCGATEAGDDDSSKSPVVTSIQQALRIEHRDHQIAVMRNRVKGSNEAPHKNLRMARPRVLR